MDILVKGKILQTFGGKALVQSEHLPDAIRFVFSDPPEGGYDLNWSLMWIDEEERGDTAILDKALIDGKLVVTWLPTRTQTQSNGRLTIQLKGTETLPDGEERKWLSIVSYITIPSTLHPGTVEEIEPELFDHYLNLYQKLFDESEKVLDDDRQAALEEIKSHTDAKKTELTEATEAHKVELTEHTEAKIAEFDRNAEAKTDAFDANAKARTDSFNSNADAKTQAFNANAVEKTGTFDANASDKTIDFNSNATGKTSEFNTNAASRTREFNSNAEETSVRMEAYVDGTLKPSLDRYMSGKKEELTGHSDNLKSEMDSHERDLEVRLDNYVTGIEHNFDQLAKTTVREALLNEAPTEAEIEEAIEEAWNG